MLTYLHNDKMAAICRCSQPLSGFQKRSVEDEKLLQAILRANPGSTFMYVVDTRPKINAMANRASGKGYESEDNYQDIKFKFSGEIIGDKAGKIVLYILGIILQLVTIQFTPAAAFHLPRCACHFTADKLLNNTTHYHVAKAS